MPVPFREFVVKIHSRCDLACDYCYMYELADQTWRDRPRRMSEEMVEQAAAESVSMPVRIGYQRLS